MGTAKTFEVNKHVDTMVEKGTSSRDSSTLRTLYARSRESFREAIKILGTLAKSRLFWLALFLIATGLGIILLVPVLLCITGTWYPTVLVIPGYIIEALGNGMLFASAVRAVIINMRQVKKRDITLVGYV